MILRPKLDEGADALRKFILYPKEMAGRQGLKVTLLSVDFHWDGLKRTVFKVWV